jgi:hypothetical protein
VFLLNSRSHLVSAAYISSKSKSSHHYRRTFSRSYGAILPSSFTRVLSSALVFSTCPPVSVWGTVPQHLKLRDFSWKHGINGFVLSKQNTSSRLRIEPPDLPKDSPYTLKPPRPTGGPSSLLRPPIAMLRSTGILTRFPSTTHFCLALGADSPCADERCARKPWAFGVGAFHPHYRYSCQHSHFRYLQQTLQSTFTGLRNAPLPRTHKCAHPELRCIA